MDVEIRVMPELRVATVHHVGPYTRINEAFERLGEVAAKAGLFALQDATMVALYYDDPESTPAEQLQSDAGITVPEDASLPPTLGEARIPAGRYGSTIFVGPYEDLPAVWMRFIGEWLPASGHRPGEGPSLEVYLNDPRDTPKEELRTELRIPVA